MIQKIKFITVIDFLFLLILGFAGAVKNELLSDTVYYLAFLIPIALGVSYIFTGGAKLSDNSLVKANLDDFKINKNNIAFSLPLIAPEIAIVALISVGTAALMRLLGYENTAAYNETFIFAVLLHALIPAVLEELLFRFIPVKLLKDNAKSAIIISSIMFAFAHANIFQISYAFAAGIIFASVYISTGSIIPCVAMHFMNNLFSLMSIYGVPDVWLWVPLGVLLAISVTVIVLRRKEYLKAFNNIKCSDKIEIGYPPIFFALLSLALAISALFA